MEHQIITNNLVLISIEAKNFKHDKLDREVTTCWKLFFTFFGVEGFSAILNDQGITRPYEQFSVISSENGALHQSFCEALFKNWTKIVEAIKAWEAQNLINQTI